MTSTKPYSIIIFGATGYTGKLVAEYFQLHYSNSPEIRWAIAGRSLDKLLKVQEDLELSDSVDLLVVDSEDQASLHKMVSQTQVVLTTVGPYQLYGNTVVEACATLGTDYLDLCGEPAWMAQMIEKHGEQAKASGARIVFSCGFDSIPFDMGVYFLQQHAIERDGAPLTSVLGRVRSMNGTFSGGTQASFKATMAAAKKDPALIQLLTNPFSLCEGFNGPAQLSGMEPHFDEELNSWSAPFVMAAINTKNVHRSNYLMSHQYGEDFSYSEMVQTGEGEKGKAAADFVAKNNALAGADLAPGEGPTKEQRDSGNYDLLFAGVNSKGELLKVNVTGDKDPGYGSTCKMLSEAAICLAQNPDLASGGFWTPAAALGTLLIDRLEANAGLTFTIEA